MIKKLLYSLFFLIFILSINLYAQVDNENDFIYNLIKFTDWEDYIIASEKPFLIGVYNSEVDYVCMQAFFTDKRCFNKKIQVQNITTIESIYNFDIIYLPEKHNKSIKNIINLCIDYDIISITTNDSSFCKNGGIINLINTQTEYKIQINNSIALKNNIFFSPQLLNLVEIIE